MDLDQDPEKAWNTAIADELREVERQADRLSKRTHHEVEAAQRAWKEHQEHRPEEPKGMSAMFGGQARYQAEQLTWEHRQAQLMTRYVYLQERADKIEQYRSDDEIPTSRAQQLAEDRAAKHHPDLAEAVHHARAERERAEQRARDTVEHALVQEQEQTPERPDPHHGVDTRHGIRDMAGAGTPRQEQEMEMDFA